MKELIGSSFTLSVEPDGVGLVLFSRPPVNAVSLSVYEEIRALVDRVESGTDVRALVLCAPESSRAWCGGADLNDFKGMDVEGRNARYAFINASLPRLWRMDRPVVAAINGAAIGVGMILAALCDMRVAAEDAPFACPEIDFELVAGGAGLFALLNMPEAKVREMLFTGARFTARQLEPTGFFNYVLPRDEVLPRAIALARQMAGKSLPAIRARKLASTSMERLGWEEAYLRAQALTAELMTERGRGG